MKTMRKTRIVLTVCAVFAAAVLFVTYGTVLPSAPFVSVQLNGPTAVASDGAMTVVADSESRRALILNAEGDLTGVVGCTTIDSPIDAITDVCVHNGHAYVSGVRFAPDSEAVKEERVAVYDKGGNLVDVVFDRQGSNDEVPSIKSLSETSDGVVVAYEAYPNKLQSDDMDAGLTFQLIGTDEKAVVDAGEAAVHDVAFVGGDAGRYVILSVRGVLNDNSADLSNYPLSEHVFTAIDIDEKALYACDDATGGLCVISEDSPEVRVLVAGDGYNGVHENGGVISLCDTNVNKVVLCDKEGTVNSEFTDVNPSIGFSARMVLVWASGLYLAALVLVLAVRKIRALVKEGKTEWIGPLLLSVAVVSAIAIAIGSLSFSSYRKSLDLRASEINMCADYLETNVEGISEAMEAVGGRDKLRGSTDDFGDAVVNLMMAAKPAYMLVDSAKANGIGMYFALYGKDAKGVFYLYGSSAKLAMAVPFGMLYALGYSLPRLTANEDERAEAAGGVKRTDTSAAALGTVLGGYAAQALGNVWVYALVAVACLFVIVMALNLLPRGMKPLEKLAQTEAQAGHIIDFAKTPAAFALALLVVLPVTVAAGYASFLFPLFSSDLGLSKADVNNIVVIGQLVVYVCIGPIERIEGRYGKWRVSMVAVALLGVTFLLFSVNTTLAWSLAVIALVGLFGKASDGWKGMWIAAAGDVGVPAGRATGSMLATRSLALVVQPFILGALLGATDSVAVIVIGALCAACAVLFFLVTRRSSLAK